MKSEKKVWLVEHRIDDEISGRSWMMAVGIFSTPNRAENFVNLQLKVRTFDEYSIAEWPVE